MVTRIRPLTRFAGALPKGEPLGARNLRGMGFARSRRLLQRCNTKAKLAIKQNTRQKLDKRGIDCES